MSKRTTASLVLATILAAAPVAAPVAAQHAGMHHDTMPERQPQPAHQMYMRALGGGWQLMSMAQLYPVYTTSFGNGLREPLTTGEFYVTQPALMLNVESPGSHFVLRTTFNLEGLTQEDGELTAGAWGEGYIDRRHPHTFLHEVMLSANLWNVLGGSASISAGKGFAPYGTDDPMSRPVVKYPTNHHLSQVLERFTLNGSYRNGGWSVEAGAFAGSEPTDPWDMGNYTGFPDSWSARLIRRFGATGTHAPLELAASYASVTEPHGHEDEESRHTELLNAYVRHEHATPFGDMYALIEGSRANPDFDRTWWSVLGELQLRTPRHEPYARLEVSTRPEYARNDTTDRAAQGFFRYPHDELPNGATRWLIATAGYNHVVRGYPWGVRLFAEGQFHNVANERGDVLATELFGTNNFFTLSAGARITIGGDRMRMGSYGVLDDMTNGMMLHSPQMQDMPGMEHRH